MLLAILTHVFCEGFLPSEVLTKPNNQTISEQLRGPRERHVIWVWSGAYGECFLCLWKPWLLQGSENKPRGCWRVSRRHWAHAAAFELELCSAWSRGGTGSGLGAAVRQSLSVPLAALVASSAFGGGKIHPPRFRKWAVPTSEVAEALFSAAKMSHHDLQTGAGDWIQSPNNSFKCLT